MKGSAAILAAAAGILPAAVGARLRHQPVESNQRAGRRQDAGSNGLEARAPLPLTADSPLITPCVGASRHRREAAGVRPGGTPRPTPRTGVLPGIRRTAASLERGIRGLRRRAFLPEDEGADARLEGLDPLAALPQFYAVL